MSEIKPVYLLAGGRASGNSTHIQIIKTVYKESGVASPAIGYVGVANGDDTTFIGRMAGMLKEAGGSKIEHALIAPAKANLNKAKDILRKADIVFISGGDVEYGMQVLEEKDMTGFLYELYKQGKPFFGASAGAIMLAKEWVRWRDPDDDSTAELFPCLGMAPVICDTHDELDGWQELQKAVELRGDNSKGYGIVSGTAIKVYPDGRVEALGGAVQQYIRKNGKVSPIAQLQPL